MTEASKTSGDLTLPEECRTPHRASLGREALSDMIVFLLKAVFGIPSPELPSQVRLRLWGVLGDSSPMSLGRGALGAGGASAGKDGVPRWRAGAGDP